MEILKLILHIMDTQQNIFVPSDREIEKMNEDIYPHIESKLKKIFNSQNKKEAHFVNSPVEQWIFDYKTNPNDFVKLSVQIANHIFEEKRKWNLFQTSDFIFAEVKHEDIRYLVGTDNVNFSKLTHATHSDDTQIQNDFILYKTLFSSNIMKEDRIFIVEYATSHLQLIENPYIFQTTKRYVLEDILSCKAKPSYKEAISAIHECVENLTNKYQMDDLKTLPALKTAVKERVEEGNQIETNELAELLFENPIAQSEFKEELKKQGIEETVNVENIKLNKQQKTQKIKTDNGIEITIPIDYMSSREFVEFVSEHDGTISIRLKNIQSIMSK